MKKIILLILILFIATTLHAYDFSITVPDAHVTRIRDALCAHWDYGLNCLKDAGDVCNETKKAFIERMIRRKIKNIVKNVEIPVATNQTYINKNSEIEALNIE